MNNYIYSSVVLKQGDWAICSLSDIAVRSDAEKIATRIIKKLLRKRVIGSNKVTIQTAVSWLETHQQGDGKKIIEKLCTEPECPLEYYGGGNRKNIRLTSYEAAKKFIKNHGGKLPFGVEE